MTHTGQRASAEALSKALHDLSQPITALSFAAEMAMMSSDPEEWRASLATIREQSSRAAAAFVRSREAADAVCGAFGSEGLQP